MLQNRGIPGTRVLNGLLQLTDKYTGSAINSGCENALQAQVFDLKGLKEYIRSSFSLEQQTFEFLDEHPFIRKMSEYENGINTKGFF
jgi:hypothetical protein